MATTGVEIADSRLYYGFVYMWCDIKHNLYYIGSHRGSIHDGYLCSSKWCKRSIKKRPSTFRRIILSYCNTELELNDREEKYLRFYNAAESYVFYNFKNSGRGGSGPVKWKGMTKSQYYADKGISWIDPRRGKTRQEIYGANEAYRLSENIINKHKQFILDNGHGYRFGVRNRQVDYKKGKLYRDIYSESKPLANPPKPFIITIEEPDKLPYDIYCLHEIDFFEKLKMENTTMAHIKKHGYKIIKRLLPTTRHILPRHTILRLKYV